MHGMDRRVVPQRFTCKRRSVHCDRAPFASTVKKQHPLRVESFVIWKVRGRGCLGGENDLVCGVGIYLGRTSIIP
jgi:hypothetical protein